MSAHPDLAVRGVATPNMLFNPAITRGAILHQPATIIPGNNTAICLRLIVPRKGYLRGIQIPVSAASGNVKGLVYDTGDAAANTRTLLWTGAATAVGGTGLLSLGDPASTGTWAGGSVPLLYPGQHLDIGFVPDNGTVAVVRTASAGAGFGSIATLPTGDLLLPSGVTPKMTWTSSTGTYASPASTLSEANCSGSNYMIWVDAWIKATTS